MKKINNQNGSVISILLIISILVIVGLLTYMLKNNNINSIELSTENNNSTSSQDMEVQKDEKATGFIKSVYTKNNKNYIDIDYVIIESCIETKPDNCPNGVSLKNDNSLIRTFEISSNVIVNVNDTVIDSGGKNVVLSNIGYNGLVSIFQDKSDYRNSNPWNIVVKGGLIVEVTEHFIP